MKRVVLILAAAATAVTTAACGGGDVVVAARLQGSATATEETDAVALGAMPVRLFPFDRDVIFDSLAQSYSEPEPQVPDSIADLQDRVIERQREYQEANNRWQEGRERLQSLSDTLRIMDQSSGGYFALFQEFNDLEGEVRALEGRANAAFEEFTSLQTRLNQQGQEITAARRLWADEAFASVDSVFDARLVELDMEVQYDTTNAQGVAVFRGLDPGQWWVTARYDRQYDELYWNEPIEVARGEEIQVMLTEENAEVRQKM